MEGTPLFELFQQEDSDAAYRFLENCTEEWLTQEQEEKQTKDVILHFIIKMFLPDAQKKKESDAPRPRHRPAFTRDQFQLKLVEAFGIKKCALRKHVDMKDFRKTVEAVKEHSPALVSELEEATSRNDDEESLDETGSGVENAELKKEVDDLKQKLYEQKQEADDKLQRFWTDLKNTVDETPEDERFEAQFDFNQLVMKAEELKATQEVTVADVMGWYIEQLEDDKVSLSDQNKLLKQKLDL